MFGTVELAGDHRESAADVLIRCAYALQVEELFRAEEVAVFDRGNGKTTVTFKVARKHISPDEAADWMLEHETALSGVEDVTFITARGSKRYLQGAAVESYSGSQIGATTYSNYTLAGGLIRKEKTL